MPEPAVRGEAIPIASDHGGFQLKETVREYLAGLGFEAVDLGCHDESSVDYPDYAFKIATAVASGEYHRGILICGTGIGMSIAANRVPGVRAALCHDAFTARMSREHNDANLLVLGGTGIWAITEPVRIALPTGVIRPSQRPNVPSPDAKAACRSDQVEEYPYFGEILLLNWGVSAGATALYPSDSKDVTICFRRISLVASPKIRPLAHLSAG